MDEPIRPRLFSVMGWIFILFGAWFPVRTLFDLYPAWKSLDTYDLFWKQWKPFTAILAGTLVFSAVDALSGWGLLKRRSWAPLLSALAGGMSVAGAGWLLYGLKEYLLPESGPYAPPQPAVRLHDVVTRMVDFVPTLVHAICWLILLGALSREDGRREFPPGGREFSPRHFWTAAAAGAAIMCLYNGALAWILREPANR